MKKDKNDSQLPPIPKPIWGIGLAVFFVNLSSVMVRSLSAVYMKTILGAGSGLIGTVEGVVEMLSFIMKMLSGVFSDYLRRRKLIIVLGYAFMFFSRPLIAGFASMQAVVAARILDRLGNGIQASPRDALVGDLAPRSIRGACYGLRISLGTAGSFAGAVFALSLMFWNDEDYLVVFWLAAIPAFIAVVIMAFFIKDPEKVVQQDPENEAQPAAQQKPYKLAHLRIEAASEPSCSSRLLIGVLGMFMIAQRMGRSYWLLMIVVAVFMVAQLGEPIMDLHALETFHLSGKYIPLIAIVYNAAYSSISYSAGKLSDKIGRINMLIIGFCCLLVGDLFLGGATSLWMVFAGIALCGAQIAITQSTFMSLIADCVPEDLRGTGFGIFYLICALSVFISHTGTGFIAEHAGERYAFIASLVVASIALVTLVFFAKKIAPKEKVPLSI